jgi:hypothetical protein
MPTRTGARTGLTAVAVPSSGPTPGSFHVVPSGGVPPYTVGVAPSPPNPEPMPPVEIDGMEVHVLGHVLPPTKLYFVVNDAAGNAVTVSYTAAP